MKRFIYIIFSLLLLFFFAFTSCSPKKNNAATRKYQAFITRYNIYYNGDEHYKETLKEMEKNYEDDFSAMLFLHPADARAFPKSPQPQGDFTRSIEKGQKAIQLRSIKKRPKKNSGKSRDPKYKEWMKREEYNPFLHNAWMMMGRSQYMNGDFLGGASTFYYISKHFWWLPETVTEAKLWQARCYASLDWMFEAENILVRIKEDELTNNTNRHLFNHTYTQYYIKLKDYDKAIPHLIEAIKYAKGAQKTRHQFLLGQLHALNGQKTEAYQAFKKAGSSNSTTYRTKFNARIKQSEVFSGENIESEVKALKRMTRYDRNKEYLDQIYYAIGNLYLSRQDTVRAIENYILAAEKSTRNGIDKAINQITLGELYFAQSKYDLAQPCYSEAVPVLPETYPNYDLLKRRSDVLDELAVYSQNVTLQDSLLRLSEMTEDQQRAVIDKIIKELKKKEEEEAENARREEYLANQAAMGSNLQNNSASTPNSFVLNTDDSWYFYNTATKNAGKTDFQKRWGSRKLEDDWRRRNKTSFNTSDFDSDSDDEDDEDNNTDSIDSELNGDKELSNEDKEKLQRETDPHYPEYYLKQIPSTDEEKQIAHDVIQEGLYNMGIILKDKLEDYNAAATQFDRLLTDYPDNIYRLEVYYNLYLMFMREGKNAIAERYRALILANFPESNYGLAMVDPNYLQNMKDMDTRQEQMYERAYEAYLNNDNKAVHKAYEDMKETYPLSKIMSKFMFLHALAYVTEKNPEEFNATLRSLLELYPETDITPLASSYLKQMAQGRKLESGATNMRGMLWDIKLAGDSVVSADGVLEFNLNPQEPHTLILTYPTDTVSANQLLFDIARHNFTSFVVKDFDLEQMNFGQLGMLIIKGFNNLDELSHYRSVMATNENLVLPQQVRPIVISVKNFELLLQKGRSFEDYFNYLEEKMAEDDGSMILSPELFGIEKTQITEDEDIEDVADELIEPDIDNEEFNNLSDRTSINDTIVKPIVIPEIKDSSIISTPKQPIAPIVEKEKPDTVTKPIEKPLNNPVSQPKQKNKSAVKPQLPEYPTGSEGDDDPLLDMP